MYYLGTMTAASGGYYNNVTGASGIGTFSIPVNVRSLYLVPSASGVGFLLSAATGTTAFVNDRNNAPLNAPIAGAVSNPINGPFQVIAGTNITVGIYNAVGGFVSVRVYAAPTS